MTESIVDTIQQGIINMKTAKAKPSDDYFICFSPAFVRNNWVQFVKEFGLDTLNVEPYWTPETFIDTARKGELTLMGCKICIVDKLPKFR